MFRSTFASTSLVGFILYVVGIQIHAEEVGPLTGHLERLGNQGPKQGHIEVLDSLPSPTEFFENYIVPGKPVVFKGAAKPMPAYQNWNDEYLKENFGKLVFDVEEGKKENRSQRSFRFTMKDYIDKYKTEDIYMVHSIQKEMRRDVTLLPMISCGGYTNILQDIVLWFSSGGTKSVLHTDGVENVNCLFSGSKALYMVDKKYDQHIEFDNPRGYSNVDPDAVDLTRYPGLAKAPWWEANMESGDCLYIPLKWFHQVRSVGRNMAVNVWFTHPNKINYTDCKSYEWQDKYIPLTEFKLKNNAGSRQMLALELGKEGKMARRHFATFLKENLQIYERRALKELLDMIDKNNDKVIEIKEVMELNDEEISKVQKLLPMGYEEEAAEEGAEEGMEGEEDGYEEIPPEGDISQDEEPSEGDISQDEKPQDDSQQGTVEGEEETDVHTEL